MGTRKTIHIAISSQKGGVAKTTTCLSLGACLVELGHFVLLIDLDPQAHLTQSFGFQPHRIKRTIAEALLNQATLLSVSKETNISGLEIIPANSGLLLIDKLLYNTTGYEYRLKNSLDHLQGGYYDFILIDCPPTFGPLTLNALSSAEFAIIPTTCDYFSAQSLQGYMDLFDQVRKRNNPDIALGILVTMFDRRLRVTKLILEQFRNKYGSTMFETTISLDVRLRESPLFASPITTYAPESRSATDYRALAKELLSMEWLNARSR